MPLKVLYEDNHVIAVVKPAGVLSQGDKTGDKSLMDDIKQYLKEKHQKPGNVFLAPVHRLDRPVSGIVLYAKTSKGASRISEQFREREIQKTYHAIVIGKMEKPQGEIVNYITKVSYFAQAFVDGKNLGHAAGQGQEKAKKAELTYRVVGSNNKYSLLEIKPKTGRFHQIRIQLSSMGHPIVGDGKYSSPALVRQFRQDWKDRKSIALCATGLKFKLPTKEEFVEVSSPIPEEWKAVV